MTRIFCDKCKKELLDHREDRVMRSLGIWKIEILVAKDGVWNAGDVCQDCVLKIVNEGKP